MFLEDNKIVKKIIELEKKAYSKLEAFFSSKYFIVFIFLYSFIYLFLFSVVKTFAIDQTLFYSGFTLLISFISVFLLFKFNKFFPFAVLGSILILFSFFGQRFETGVEYTLIYYLGYGLISAALVYSLIKRKNKLFWISMFLFFFSSLSPLITPQILIGDERILLTNLTKLESGEFLPSDFGEHNYVNVSFVYFYYLVIIAKILGTSVANIFFFLKFFFLVMIFLSFYLIATRFIDEKLAIFVVFIAFFPINNIHLAPQIIGKYIIFLVFIYFYLKYFEQLNSRIILVVMMLLITYINLTTLYISIAVFGFFVFVFFFKHAISRKAYFTDLIILFMFIILVGTYSSSIDLFGLTEGYADLSEEDFLIFDENTTFFEEEKETIVREEQLNPKADPLAQKLPDYEREVKLINEKQFENVPFIRRLVPFLNNYVSQFGLEQLVEKVIHYSLIGLLVLTAFFVYPKKRHIGILALALFFLVLFLIHIQFQDGVHATLDITSILLGVCIVLLFHKKAWYFIPIMLVTFAAVSTPILFNISQYGEANQLFASEFSSEDIIGEKLTPVTKFSGWSSNEYYNSFGFTVSCLDSTPYDFYLNDVRMRCDEFSRIGSIGKKIYENEYSKVYIVSAEELEELNKNLN